MAFELSNLDYDYDALEPSIDARTMRLHHDAHHRAYVEQLNKAIAPYPKLINRTIEDLLLHLNDVPEEIRTTVRNSGGGHMNHELFWKTIGPPTGAERHGVQVGDVSLGVTTQSTDKVPLTASVVVILAGLGLAAFGSRRGA